MKLRKNGKGHSILSPSGVVFKSRRSAYEVMVREKQPNEDIEAMRSVLKHEGWVDNPELPGGWKVMMIMIIITLIIMMMLMDNNDDDNDDDDEGEAEGEEHSLHGPGGPDV